MLTIGPCFPSNTGDSLNEQLQRFQEQIAPVGSFPVLRTYSEQEYEELKRDRDHWRTVALKLLEAR